MTELHRLAARQQTSLADSCFDSWVTPSGAVRAEFHRIGDGFLLRFPGEADFEIFPDLDRVHSHPEPGLDPDYLESLYTNAVLPILGNHRGGLFLHGSAVAINGRAVAFLGLSRSGKTTLAAALAQQGHALLTEDVIELVRSGAAYELQPKSAALRLFPDSAAYLTGRAPPPDHDGLKQSIPAEAGLAYCAEPAPLSHLYLLGRDREAEFAIRPLGAAAALAEMLHHSFILDVEDRQRLNAHFCRIAELCESIPCSALDYPRRYSELPRVLDAIVRNSLGSGGNDAG
ncbi:MAG: hypothetical protein GC147_04325 [Porphyrobacter sp.]|nr:hypothetical protein [Porphyrobacter sp.]